MRYFCCDEYRREAVLKPSIFNGIDYLEVLDGNGIPESERQKVLIVYLLKPLGDLVLTRDNIQIEGGERIKNIEVEEITTSIGSPEISIKVHKYGDFSPYTLRLVTSQDNLNPPKTVDPNSGETLAAIEPILAAIDFSFKVNCPSDFDCRQERICPSEPKLAPEIDYLAKDYASFRQLMLDRLATLTPQWQERNVADVGINLVELLAYVGDYLSYQQDAIATEAYLGTVRRRISARRHARLVDYSMHDGCNARVWVQVQVKADNVLLDRHIQLFTNIPEQNSRISPPPNSPNYDRAISARPEVFETMQEILLFQSHNEIEFYTWGDKECCLAKGATRATLRDREASRLLLCVGDVLIFEEKLNPKTGLAIDANLQHRHAVRLTKVSPEAVRSPKDGQEINRTPGLLATDPLTNQPIVEIEWHTEDALPFPLCISAKTDREHDEKYQENVSIALGNIVLADCGRTIEEKQIVDPQGKTMETETISDRNGQITTQKRIKATTIDRVPEPIFKVPLEESDRCQNTPAQTIPPRFNPRLQQAPLTQTGRVTKINPITKQRERVPFDSQASASAAFQWQMENVIPAITLEDSSKMPWKAQRDLLASDASAKVFVVEVETDGIATIRFGDSHANAEIGKHGMFPRLGTSFAAIYRVGNGSAGNVSAEAIAHIITNDDRIETVRNPLPARGGVEPESIEDVRQKAPAAFRIQERAVTPEDYAEVVQRHPQVQQAAATFRWTGSWYTVFVTVDRFGGLPVDDRFKGEIRQHLEKYRMAGYDLEIDAPIFVSLEIAIKVCVKPDYFRSNVKLALLEVFSDRLLPDGRKGVFHPDNFTFGQSVYLSALYTATLSVAGVASLEIITFQRQGTPSRSAIDRGYLALGRLEIARLENNPNFPERGVLRLIMEGGK